MDVRTRFAPSPTGSLHVGGARTALYCLLFARHHGGSFLLRIEDTDRARSTAEAARGILEDLRWLGIDWDEGPGRPDDRAIGPFFQSHRLDLYDRLFDRLVDEDKAYLAWDTPEELNAARDAAIADKRNYRYARRAWSPGEIEARQEAGVRPVVRLASPDHAITVDDLVLGPVTQTADELDDLVLRKADGFPTYHYAVVVDDHTMGVSLVLRGQEHLMNTHKHLCLYEAFGWTPPDHAHLPLIFNPSGSKMSKRDKAKAARAAAKDAQAARVAQGHPKDDWSWLAKATGQSLDDVVGFVLKKHDGVAMAEAIAAHLQVDLPMIEVMDFRRGGYVPEALLNYLALLGWSPGDGREILSMTELIEAFDLERVNKTAARFDVEKLTWMNGEYLRALDMDRLLDVQDAYLQVVPGSPFQGADRALRASLIELYRPRINTFADLDRQAAFFFRAPTSYDPAAVDKHIRKGGGLERLAALRGVLQAVSPWTSEAVHGALEGWAAGQGVGLGKVAQPIRVAMTGTAVSPGIGETLELLGRDETLSRVDAALGALAT